MKYSRGTIDSPGCRNQVSDYPALDGAGKLLPGPPGRMSCPIVLLGNRGQFPGVYHSGPGHGV